MLNAKKFKKEIESFNYMFAVVENKVVGCANIDTCENCEFKARCGGGKIKWLLEEYKESILTDEEKTIIKDIIKAFEPFGKELSYITKERWNYDEKCCYLNFKYGDDNFGTLNFNSDELFKGMKISGVYRNVYTPEELGL